jgi:hypothetical protein
MIKTLTLTLPLLGLSCRSSIPNANGGDGTDIGAFELQTP